jgi:hypothetical protein
MAGVWGAVASDNVRVNERHCMEDWRGRKEKTYRWEHQELEARLIYRHFDDYGRDINKSTAAAQINLNQGNDSIDRGSILERSDTGKQFPRQSLGLYLNVKPPAFSIWGAVFPVSQG